MGSPSVNEANEWLKLMSRRLGHNILELIEQDERVLMGHRLLTGRRSRGAMSNFSAVAGDEGAVDDANGRLTALGARFCENIKNYQNDLEACSE